jgi:hypothetical protein
MLTAKLSRLFLALALTAAPFLESGCTAAQVASAAQNTAVVIGKTIALAQAELPALQATGLFSAAEGTVIAGYLTTAANLDGQLVSCNTAATAAGSKKAAFLSCVTIFATGLANPAELTALRVINPKAQAKVLEWLGVVTLSVNLVVTLAGGTAVPAPVIGTTPAPAASALRPLAIRAGVSARDFDRAVEVTHYGK